MTRSLRIARHLVADLPESPRLDFWAAVLHAVPNADVQAVGDMVEERYDDAKSRGAVAWLESNFGQRHHQLAARFPIRTVEEALLRVVRGQPPYAGQQEYDWNLPSSQLVEVMGRSLLSIAYHSVQRHLRTPVTLGTLHRGQAFFHEGQPDVSYFVVGHERHAAPFSYSPQQEGLGRTYIHPTRRTLRRGDRYIIPRDSVASLDSTTQVYPLEKPID
jgi:hypothetical protein